MKRLYIFVAIITLAVVSASAQITRLFDRYSDTKGVTSVYISKTMINMMPDLELNDIELKGMGDKLNNIRVLTTENSALVSKISQEATTEIKKDGYEILLSANDDGEKTVIYLKTDDKGINNYIIIAQEPKELCIVLISGTLKPSDIKKLNLK